jgi:DNA-binding NarL/FixJ family response regulator
LLILAAPHTLEFFTPARLRPIEIGIRAGKKSNMIRTKLVNMDSGTLELYAVDAMPPYLAASHAWSDGMFMMNTEYKHTLGGIMIQNSVRSLFPDVTYCWIDTICIDQNDEEDKKSQIPLMGDIYGNAQAVVIVTTCEFRMTQAYLNQLTKDLEEGIAISLEEEYTDSMSHHWKYGEGRQKIIEGMDCLELFTRTRWADRIWTLQEYILARQIVWVGKDNVCLRIDDVLFRALPDLCDVFDIREAIGGKYSKIYEFYSGMASAGAGKIDPTRVMELLGNRTASFPDDEVYGAMAASGVIIRPGVVSGQENVWSLWWEEAIRQGHHRWIFLPPVLHNRTAPGYKSSNCIMPDFKIRHKASQNSGLDRVNLKTGDVTIFDGGVKMIGRWAGSCHVVRRLGKVYEDSQGNLHRDITLILFARGSWKSALRLVAAFGGGRYSWKQSLAIAQVLQANYYRAIAAVKALKERKLILRRLTEYQSTVWADFMRLSMSQMVPMNDGIAYLAQIRNALKSTDIIVVVDDHQPLHRLHALDFGIQTASERTPFMIVAAPEAHDGLSSYSIVRHEHEALHKIGMSLPTIVCKDLRKAHTYRCHVVHPTLRSFKIGGKACWFCATSKPVPVSEAIISQQKNRPAVSYSMKAALTRRRNTGKL